MGQPSSPPKGSRKKRLWRPWFAVPIACIVFFLAGWYGKSYEASTRLTVPKSLRLTGYQFISPLLSCNLSNPKLFPPDQALNNAIQSVIEKHLTSGDVSKASTYFADFTTGQWSETYQNEQYYPSSLGKIPIAMAYYLVAESSTDILDKQIAYPLGSPDLNATQDIPPAEAIVPGQSYTVEQLIEYMLEYSDNNAAQLLYENIDPASLQGVYEDLQIPFEEDVNLANADFITPQQVATMFKVLYNATYLSRDYSEQILQLMSQSSFTQGIVAGVPSSTIVAHKLGLVVITEGGVTTEHELHDCGIVYVPSDTYLLCVMTRGSSSLPTMEGIIADISRTVYQEVTSGK